MKKVLSLLLILFLLPFNKPIYANEIDITSEYVLLYNLNDDEIIYEINSEKQVNIASLTKMITALVAIENCDDLNEKVKIEEQHLKDLDGYSKAGFKVGDLVTVKDLLYGIILPSGADACNAIAYHIAKDMDSFIEMMNQKAIDLKLNNTHFDNPIGKDSKNNYSNAKDLSNLLKYALKNPIFKEIFCTKYYKINNLDLNLKSTLIGYSKKYDINTDFISGSKTGYTSGAGYCLASIATINDIDYMLIVLNSDTDLKYNAILDSIKIYEHFSKNYGYHQVISKNDILYQLPIKWGMQSKYVIHSNKEIIQYINNDFNKEDLQFKYEGIENIDYTMHYKDKLGTIQIIYKDKIIDEIDVNLDKKLIFIDPIFICIIISIILVIYLKRKNRV